MTTKAIRPMLFAGALLATALAAPAAHADWRGRGHGGYGWGPPARHWAPPPPVYYGHRHHYDGAPLLGALLGLGAGVVIGSALAAPPPPPVYYAPPPPPAYYVPPAPPAYYAPAPDYAPSKSMW